MAKINYPKEEKDEQSLYVMTKVKFCPSIIHMAQMQLFCCISAIDNSPLKNVPMLHVRNQLPPLLNHLNVVYDHPHVSASSHANVTCSPRQTWLYVHATSRRSFSFLFFSF